MVLSEMVYADFPLIPDALCVVFRHHKKDSIDHVVGIAIRWLIQSQSQEGTASAKSLDRNTDRH